MFRMGNKLCLCFYFLLELSEEALDFCTAPKAHHIEQDREYSFSIAVFYLPEFNCDFFTLLEISVYCLATLFISSFGPTAVNQGSLPSLRIPNSKYSLEFIAIISDLPTGRTLINPFFFAASSSGTPLG